MERVALKLGMEIDREMKLMSEQWVEWKPVDGLSQKYYIESISDVLDGFRIVLSDADKEENKVNVIFENSVHAYRSTDESFRQSTINILDEAYGTQFYSEWTFFKVVNSEYMKWLSVQSYNIIDSESLIHFSFFAVDSIVDVIAAYEPKVELL
ncbi:hypothetical protein JOC73_001660 [Alkaliphilus hydrothermalis]|uniref:Uncharacterized protein n=2 Tax=Alkaliphilus hydrothermalis TaxID=1482730 RepID=A0ABS2NQ59_9FIRM|nr:hypothetical protein [Alkaliphilus hydrothermalis]